MNRAAAVLIAALTFAASFVSAATASTKLRQYTLASWTEKDGMPSSLIWAIAQDREGYLWLGTDAGLIRFDGVRFVPWDAAGEPPVSVRAARAVLASQGGDLWIGGAGGVSRLRDGRVTNYGARDGVPERVVALCEDQEGTVWAGGFVGLSRFRNGRWERIGSQLGLPGEASVTGFYEDHQRTLWLTTSLGVFSRAIGSDSFRPLQSNLRIRALSEDASGAMWVLTEKSIRKLSDPARDIRPDSVEARIAPRILRDTKGNFWVGTLGSGVIHLSALQGNPGSRSTEIESLTPRDGLTSGVVQSLFEDREGNVWVGTQSGLNRLSEASVVTSKISGEAIEAVRAVTSANDGSMWVGTSNGLLRLSGANQKRYDERDGLPSVAVGAVHSDRHGGLWVATDLGGLSRFEGGRFLPVFNPVRSQLKLVETLTTDLDGGLWFTENAQGVFRWKGNILKSFEGVPEVRGKMGTSVITDRGGRVWIGFADGDLAAYQEGTFRTYSKDAGLPGGSVASICEDRAGGIWVGTTTGLSRFENGRFISLTSINGLAVNNVSAIIEDVEGYIWFGVTAGIIRLRPSEFDNAVADAAYRAQYTLYDMADGLPGVPMSKRGYPTAARRADGTLWFVTSNGLAVIDPRQPKKSRLPPPVRVERIIADERTLDVAPRLQLDPLTSKIQIEYTALSFTVPSRVRFRYKLEGFDSSWVEAATRRQAFYTNLPPRSYRFRVIAENDGVWNETGAVWDFSIRPAFYQTGSFRATSAVALVLAVFAAWRFRVSQVHRQFGLILAERTRMAREIHDTLLQGMVGIGLRFDSLSCTAEAPSLRKELERLRDQIEAYIREARQSIWDLRSPMLQTRTLVAALREAGESMTDGAGIRFEFRVTGSPGARAARVEEVLLRIGHEAVSNAVRHAQATQIHMELCYDTDSVRLRVTDDGRGFDFDAPVQKVEERWGLASMQERAQQIRAQFKIMSNPVGGTTVEVVAPCS